MLGSQAHRGTTENICAASEQSSANCGNLHRFSILICNIKYLYKEGKPGISIHDEIYNAMSETYMYLPFHNEIGLEIIKKNMSQYFDI